MKDEILFTYLHLAPMKELTESLVSRGVIGIAYETITAEDGTLPLLTPMSEVAGRMAIQEGAHYLEKAEGGLGMLVGGVPGVPRGEIVIIGGGVVGLNAAKMAVGLGAHVTVLDKSLPRMQYLDDIFGGRLTTLMSNPITIRESVVRADMVIGAVLIPGASAPKLVTRDMVKQMKNGAVIVDVAVDQGGCLETTRPTTHSDPDVRGRWSRALLRRQHARRRPADFDLRAHERHPSLRPDHRQQRRGAGGAGRQSPARRSQHLQGPAHF